MGSTLLNLDSGLHLGLKRIQYITEGRMKKRPENLKWRCLDMNLERQENH